jgi:hypothetical protein
MWWFSFFRSRKPGSAATVWWRPIAAEDGRQYVAGAPYLLSKDLGETNRLDFQHYMLRYALRGNYAAPLQDPRLSSAWERARGAGRWIWPSNSAAPEWWWGWISCRQR